MHHSGVKASRDCGGVFRVIASEAISGAVVAIVPGCRYAHPGYKCGCVMDSFAETLELASTRGETLPHRIWIKLRM